MQNNALEKFRVKYLKAFISTRRNYKSVSKLNKSNNTKHAEEIEALRMENERAIEMIQESPITQSVLNSAKEKHMKSLWALMKLTKELE